MNARLKLCHRAGFVTAIAMATGLAAFAGAQTILFDLGTDESFRGASVTNPDGNGNNWNSVWAGAFFPDVVDIAGNATAVDFGFSTDGGNDSFNGPAGVTSNPPTAGEIAATDIDAAALGNLGGALEGPFDFVPGHGDMGVHWRRRFCGG